MKRIGLRELRLHGRSVIERAKAGETIEVTDRGRAVARLVPITQGGSYDQMVAEGKVRPAKRGSLGDRRPLPAEPGRPTLTELLMQDRDSYYKEG